MLRFVIALVVFAGPALVAGAGGRGDAREGGGPWRDRAAQVRAAVRGSWRAYRRSARGYDDLRPVSRTGYNWMHAHATLYDALDTLYVVGLRDEFDEAVADAVQGGSSSVVARSVARLLDLFSVRLGAGVPTSVVYPVKLFEYHIRIVGGLLGAFHVSGRRELLHAAARAADVVLHAMGPLGPDASSVGRGSSADSLAGRLPRKHVRLAHQRATPLLSLLASLLDGWRATSDSVVWCNSLAGLGTFGLELRVLTRETGDPRFRDAAEKIHAEIDQRWRQNERNRTLSQGQHATVDEHREPQGDVEAPGGADGNQAPRVNGFHQNSFFLPPNLEHAWALPWMRRVGLATGDADKYQLTQSLPFPAKRNGAGAGSDPGDSYEYLLKESLVEFQPCMPLVRRYRAACDLFPRNSLFCGNWRDAGEAPARVCGEVQTMLATTPWLFCGRYVCAWGGGKLAGKESDNGGDGERGTFAKRRGSGRPHNPDTPALSKGGTYLDACRQERH